MKHSKPTNRQPKQKPITRRVERIPASDTRQMPMLAARIGGCVPLGQGVPSFETPAHITEAVCKALRDEPASGKYSLQPGMRPLRKAIAETLEKEKYILADPDSEIAVTVGAMEGLANGHSRLGRARRRSHPTGTDLRLLHRAGAAGRRQTGVRSLADRRLEPGRGRDRKGNHKQNPTDYRV